MARELLNRELYVAAVRRQVDSGTNGSATLGGFSRAQGFKVLKVRFL